MKQLSAVRIGVIGLGYVGLPLAVEFGRKYHTVGFDIDARRVSELRDGTDNTREVDADELAAATKLVVTDDKAALAECDVYIATVPTPIDQHKRPDLSPLESASRLIGDVLSKGDVVIFESTVYPGATEEVCVPIIEKHSGLTFNKDFFAGYSPERINPGDRKHRLTTILKITSGSTPEAAAFVDELYRSIITAGTYQASSIKVAEAAKVIENTQRDVNIALVNELAMIFNRLGLDCGEVLDAAATKWNFLPFRPGLVGGHCIGVDPYYLTHKSQEIGYHPEMILAGRRINDNMSLYVASQVARLMMGKRIHPAGAKVLILGLTFKENCPDIRNTQVVTLVRELETMECKVDVYDPWVSAEAAKRTYGIDMCDDLQPGTYDGIILAVAHDQFRDMGPASIRQLGKPEHVLYDVKHLLPKSDVDGRL